MTTKEFQKTSTIGIFLHYFRAHKGLFFLDMGCSLLIAAVDLAFPAVSRMAMYDLLPEYKYQAFFTVMGILLAAYVIRALLYFVVTYWGHAFGVHVEVDIRRDLYHHLQEMSFGFYNQNRTGHLMSRLTSDLFDLTELAHHGPEDLLISLITIVGALIAMFRIQWKLALVLAVLIPVAFAVVMALRREMGQTSRAVKVQTGEVNTQIESGLSGMRTAKAFTNEEREFEKFQNSNDQYFHAKRRFHKAMAHFSGAQEFFITIMHILVIAIGGFLIMRDELNYVDLITFSLYITTFVSPLRKMSNFAEMFANGFAGLNRFTELMRMEPEIQDAPDAEEWTDAQGEIALNEVEFAYPDDPNTEVLHKVSLKIHAGETMAVVGSSGGGKSTLCQLIPRFYDVMNGSVTVDGKDVRSLTQRSLRLNIGIVQQDVFLFADTIRENIRYGRLDATDEEVEEAARKAELMADIEDMPNGFDTYVGERGTLLSGGQKQRVAIARIFLKNPPILILDEATSALDSVTESHIQAALDLLSEGRTTIIIAHRLSTIRAASRIVVIDDGRIFEIGSHEELLKNHGKYAELYETQMGAARG